MAQTHRKGSVTVNDADLEELTTAFQSVRTYIIALGFEKKEIGGYSAFKKINVLK